MTKFQKQMLTIAAAGALTAVTALPAMAFENEFHGIYNFNTVFSNFNNGGGGDFNPTGLKDSNKMNNYLEQRVRLQYTAKASDDLKLVTHFEINNRFGNSQSPSNGGGAGLDTDGINLVTKHAYLDFNIGKSFNAKTGLMPYKDTLKGIFIDADVPAVVTTTKLGAYTLALGYSRVGDDAANGKTGIVTGSANKDLFIMDNTFAINKDTKVGLSYYFLADYSNSAYSKLYTKDLSGYLINNHDDRQAILLNTFGLSGETKIAGINLSGFAAMQAGHMKNAQALAYTPGKNTYFHGWAANVAANMKMGPGTAKTAFLFTSGNNSSNPGQYKGWVSSSVDSYNEGGMMIMARNTYNNPTSTDAYIRRDIQNLALLTLGYDANLTEKFSLNTNVGFGWLPASEGQILNSAQSALTNGVINKNTGNVNGSDFLGTEINLEAGYQLYKNLKVLAQGGYMILGGVYKDSITKTNGAVGTPENPYTMRLQARYSF